MINTKHQHIVLSTLLGCLLLVPSLGTAFTLEIIQPSILTATQQAFQPYGLNTADEFAQGFAEGLAEWQHIDIDIKRAEPFLPLFIERSLSEKGIGTVQAGKLAAYHFVFNTKIRACGTVLTQEESLPGIEKLNQFRMRCSAFLDSAFPQIKEAEEVKSELAYLIARDQSAMVDPTYISAIDRVDDSILDNLYTHFVAMATELLNLDTKPSVLKEKYPEEDLGDDSIPTSLQQMLRVKAVQNQFLKLYLRELPRKPFFRSPEVVQFVRGEEGRLLRQKIDANEKIFAELYGNPSDFAMNERTRIKKLYKEKMLRMDNTEGGIEQ